MTLEVKVPELNDDQCKAIFREAMNRELVKTVDGSFPEDIDVIRKDANDLVAAAIRASNAGNKSDNVTTLLFMGQVDMKPINNTGIDLTTVSDIVLDGLIDGLDKYVETPTIEQQRQAFLAEKKRRADADQALSRSQKAPQEPQDTSQGTSEKPSGATEDINVSDRSTSSGVSEERPEDAESFAGVQTTQQVQEGSFDATESLEEDRTLDSLRNKLNFDIIKAHSIDVTKIDKLSKKQLEFIIANPNGPDSAQTTIDEPKDEIDNSDMSDPSSEKSVQAVVEQPAAGPQLVSKNDFGFISDSAENTPKNISPERENLESQITGPMLKVAGRGRKEIPLMSDVELKQILASSVSKKVIAKEPVMETVEIKKEVLESAIQDEPKSAVSLGQAAKKFVDKSDLIIDTKVEEELIENDSLEKKFEEEDNRKINKAIDIINRENLPIPPDIEGEPPRLPNDVSKVSRDELFSLHARFHACESRTNWIISNFEDELGDIIKLRTAREVIFASEIPLVLDGKRTTNEYRDSLVAADKQVMRFLDQEHEVKKVINKLKVLQKNYKADCERMSRQMSKYEGERNHGPR